MEDETYTEPLRLRVTSSQLSEYKHCAEEAGASSLSHWVRDRLDESAAPGVSGLLDPETQETLKRVVALLGPLRSSPSQAVQIALERLLLGLERDGLTFLADDKPSARGKGVRRR